MNQNNNIQSQIFAQWITCLAISVVCCAILFIVFAGYVVDINKSINLLSVRLDVAQEKNIQLTNTVEIMKKEILMLQPLTQASPAMATEPAAAPLVQEPPATGVEISEPAPMDPDEAGSIAPVVTPSSAPKIEIAPAPENNGEEEKEVAPK